MKASELRKKSSKDLNKELHDLLRESFNLRTQRSMGQVSQTHQFKRIKKDIARIKMILSEQQEGSV